VWAAFASLFEWAFSWIFGGRQSAEGEKQGQAEQAIADQGQELKNVQKADDARNRVSDDPAAIVRDPDNAG
jgi:hypothetical protein